MPWLTQSLPGLNIKQKKKEMDHYNRKLAVSERHIKTDDFIVPTIHIPLESQRQSLNE